MMLSTVQRNAICKAAQRQHITGITPMQSLWAGQGELARLSLADDPHSVTMNIKSLVVKQITFTSQGTHPHGWNTELAQQRKHHSYQVEMHWYKVLAKLTNKKNATLGIPELVYCESTEQGMLMVLEDLAIEYPIRFTAGKDDRPSDVQIQSCIRWLARFHAKFLNVNVDGVWPVGGYWHLDTRPDEWQAMPDSTLKESASYLDGQLRTCPYQTVVHGDAKLANFCLDNTGKRASAVDFQYVGQGPGIKDLMLLLSSVLPDDRLMTEATLLVDFYFEQLAIELKQWQPDLDSDEVILHWRPLYAVAWADFNRFLCGWSPNHWKIGTYCQQQTQLALINVKDNLANHSE